MSLNSIIFLDDTNARSNSVNTDFYTNTEINTVLSKSTFDLMAIESSLEEIHLRQDIFRKMLNGSLYTVFLSVRKELAELDSLFYAYDSSKNLLEQIFRSRLVCSQYISVCNKLKASDYENTLLSKLCLFADSMSTITEDAQKYIASTQKEFEKLLNIQLKLYNKISSANTSDRGIFNALMSLAQNLSVKTGEYHSHLRIDNHTADLICKINAPVTNTLMPSVKKYMPSLNRDILNIRKDIEFYLNICDLVRFAQNNGIGITIPDICDTNKYVAENAVNISMLKSNGKPAVPNDIFMENDKKFFFINGANGSGKTTYLKTVAVNAFFAIFGCPVFCSKASLCKFKKIHILFPADDSNKDAGRFDTEKASVRQALSNIEHNELFLFNEIFSSTFTEKAENEIADVVLQLKETDSCGLFVTHFDMPAKTNAPILIADAATHKITFVNENISSSVQSILEKYGLSEDGLKKRFKEHKNA